MSAGGAGTAPAAPAAERTRRLLQAPVIPMLLRLAGPNTIINVMLIAVSAGVDALVVGRLGAEPLAGLALVFPLVMLMQQMANTSMGGAITAAVARALGGGREAEARALAVHGLWVGAGMAGLFGLVLVGGGRLLYGAMGGRGGVLEAAVAYGDVVFGGALAYWTVTTLASVVRGTGQLGFLAAVFVATEVLHAALASLLVFGGGPLPALGPRGAALANVGAFTLTALVLWGYLASGRGALRLSLAGVRLRRALFADILRVGAPASVNVAVNNLALVALTALVAPFGAAALAGYGIAVRLEYLLIPVVFGLGSGLIALVGANVGAGRIDKAERVAWTAARLAAGLTGGAGVLAVLFPETWMALFTADATAQAFGATYLRVVGLAYVFLGLGQTLDSGARGAGRPLWPFVSGLGRAALATGGGWIVVRMLGGGLPALYAAVAAGLVLFGLSNALAVAGGAWRRGRAPAVVEVAATLRRLAGRGAPSILGAVNDMPLKLARLTGESPWHRHERADKLLLVLDGRLRLRLRDGDRDVAAGELFVIPRGAEHSAQALSKEVHLLVLGPAPA